MDDLKSQPIVTISLHPKCNTKGNTVEYKIDLPQCNCVLFSKSFHLSKSQVACIVSLSVM